MRLGLQHQKWDGVTREWVYTEGGEELTMWPAGAEGTTRVLLSDPNLPDGWTRSEWLWIRLANGDLILGVYPQDDLYESLSRLTEIDYIKALQEG